MYSDIVFGKSDRQLVNYEFNYYNKNHLPTYPGHDMHFKLDMGSVRSVLVYRLVDEMIEYASEFSDMLITGSKMALKKTTETAKHYSFVSMVIIVYLIYRN